MLVVSFEGSLNMSLLKFLAGSWGSGSAALPMCVYSFRVRLSRSAI